MADLSRIEAWIQREDDELLYDADMGGVDCGDFLPTPPDPPSPGVVGMGSTQPPAFSIEYWDGSTFRPTSERQDAPA